MSWSNLNPKWFRILFSIHWWFLLKEVQRWNDLFDDPKKTLSIKLFLVAKFRQKTKQNKTYEDEVIWRFSTIRNYGEKEVKINDFYIWFSVHNYKYERMIKYLYSIFGF